MKIIVTGSAGFIGSAFVHYMANVPGARTTGVDNLSRRGAAINLSWLRQRAADHGTIAGAIPSSLLTPLVCGRALGQPFRDSSASGHG